MVEASDGAVDPRRTSFTVSVQVTDIDDNSPVFSQQTYVVNVPENSPVGTVVLQLSVRTWCPSDFHQMSPFPWCMVQVFVLKRLLESFNFKSSQFSSLKCQMLPDRGNYAASNIYNLLCSAVTALCAFFFRIKLKTSSNRQTGFRRELFFNPSQPMLIECLLFVVKEIEKNVLFFFSIGGICLWHRFNPVKQQCICLRRSVVSKNPVHEEQMRAEGRVIAGILWVTSPRRG